MTATGSLAGRILAGSVWHERRDPTVHRFANRMWWADLDLDRLDQTLAESRVLTADRGRPLRFERADYLGDPATPLAAAVRDLVEERTGTRPTGPVRLVGQLRTFGWCFNPIALYLCHAGDGALEWVVADVTNTPWKERHQYVLPAGPGGVHGHEEPKALHVSPFMPMDQRYRFDIAVGPDRLSVRIVTLDDDTEPFAAGVEMTASPLTDGGLARALVRHPLLTHRVSLGIHAQALRLWRKRVPFHSHPDRRSSTSPHQEVPVR